MSLDIWTIHGNSFHFGQHGLGQEETNASFSSDSLFAALVARLARTEGPRAAADFVQPFLSGKPPFVLSSTFPLVGSVCFFPTPAHGKRSEAEGVTAKQLKSVTHISETLYRQMLSGKPLAGLFSQAVQLQGGSLLASREDVAGMPDAQRRDPTAPLWVIEQRPRVTIERDTNKSNIFFTGRLVFAPEVGLWFGASFHDGGQSKPHLENLLLDLAEAGLGAERSIGFGACSIEASTPLDLPDKGDGPWTTLSRYLPRADETAALDHPAASYTIRTVGGWLDSPARSGQRRKPVNMLAEGSIFGPLARDIPGEIADARPVYPSDADPLGHAVYRCGLALAVGLQGGTL